MLDPNPRQPMVYYVGSSEDMRDWNSDMMPRKLGRWISERGEEAAVRVGS